MAYRTLRFTNTIIIRFIIIVKCSQTNYRRSCKKSIYNTIQRTIIEYASFTQINSYLSSVEIFINLHA